MNHESIIRVRADVMNRVTEIVETHRYENGNEYRMLMQLSWDEISLMNRTRPPRTITEFICGVEEVSEDVRGLFHWAVHEIDVAFARHLKRD